MQQRMVQVPAQRLERWIAGFRERHGGSSAAVAETLELVGADGATASIRPPFPVSATSETEFARQVKHVPRTAVVVVRRGGFLAAVVEGAQVLEGSAGKRHVQGRTAAGGWSQQRFARRRDKQVHELTRAAADYVARVVIPELPVVYLATGGDRPLVDEVLSDPRITVLRDLPRGPHLPVNDPRKATIADLPELLSTVRIDLVDP